MRRFMVFALALAGMAYFADEASAQRWRGRGYVYYSSPGYYYTTPAYSYSYGTPGSYYYSSPGYWSGGYYYSTYPSTSYYSYPSTSYYYSSPGYYYDYPVYSRGGVWYGDRRWGIGVRW